MSAIRSSTPNPVHLKASWDATGKSTKEDWQEWMRGFSVTVLHGVTESRSEILRKSWLSIYPPLARELFNSAFVSCWGDLFEPYQASCCLFRTPLQYNFL